MFCVHLVYTECAGVDMECCSTSPPSLYVSPQSLGDFTDTPYQSITPSPPCETLAFSVCTLAVLASASHIEVLTETK